MTSTPDGRQPPPGSRALESRMRGNPPVRFGKGPSEKDPNHGHLAGGLLHPPHPRRTRRARHHRCAVHGLADPQERRDRRGVPGRWCQGHPLGCSGATDEFGHGTLDRQLPARAAGPDPGLEPAAPDDRAARLRGLLQHPPPTPGTGPKTPQHQPSQAIDMTARIERRQILSGLVSEYHRAA